MLERQRPPSPIRRLLIASHNEHYGGGAEFVLRELVDGLRRIRPDLDVLVVFPGTGEGELVRDVSSLGAGAVMCAAPRWADFGRRGLRGQADVAWRLIRGTRDAMRVLRQYGPDIVVTNTMVIPTFAFAARRLGVPHVWAVQEFGQRDHALQFLFGYRATMRAIGRLSDAVACCSDAVRSEVDRIAHPALSRTVYYGVDVRTDCADPRVERRSRQVMNVVLVGRLTPSKGQVEAIESLGRARSDGADVRLRLYGPAAPAELEAVQAAVRRHKMDDVVSVLGPVKDVRAAFCGADVALMCSRDEAFGRVTVEAMKFGLPVVGFASGGTTEIVEHGVTGLLVPPGDTSAMGEALTRLWADEEMRRCLGRQAAISACERFAVERYAANTLEFLEECLVNFAKSTAPRVRRGTADVGD